MRVLKLIAALAAVLLVAAGCGGSSDGDGQKNESKVQQDNYNRLVAKTPAKTMEVSPTRDTVNFWIETWGKNPNKLSYVYLIAANGQAIGYYVFKGLPVNYCVSLTPNYKLLDVAGDSMGPNLMVPAPSIDGVYYSGGGCQTFYGRDASTNSYLEYTVGSGINVLLYERPLPRQDAEPLGFTVIGQE
jgi:hypothetical protein